MNCLASFRSLIISHSPALKIGLKFACWNRIYIIGIFSTVTFVKIKITDIKLGFFMVDCSVFTDY